MTSRSTLRSDAPLVYFLQRCRVSASELSLSSFAYIFRCNDGQADICIKTTTPSQLGALRGKIDEVDAEILDTKKALAATQSATDIEFLRQQLGALNKEKIILREQETILLRSQVSGEQCHAAYCHPLAELAELHAHLFRVLQGLRPPRECCQPYT